MAVYSCVCTGTIKHQPLSTHNTLHSTGLFHSQEVKDEPVLGAVRVVKGLQGEAAAVEGKAPELCSGVCDCLAGCRQWREGHIAG